MNCLIYRSKQVTPHWPVVILDIVRASERRNLALGVSGMLLFGRGGYIQYLEGPARATETVWRLIAADPRHDVIWHRWMPLTDLQLSPLPLGYFDFDRETDQRLPVPAALWATTSDQGPDLGQMLVDVARDKYPALLNRGDGVP